LLYIIHTKKVYGADHGAGSQ